MGNAAAPVVDAAGDSPKCFEAPLDKLEVLQFFLRQFPVVVDVSPALTPRVLDVLPVIVVVNVLRPVFRVGPRADRPETAVISFPAIPSVLPELGR